MAELIFIEGVSGVGKTTLVRGLAEKLRTQGRTVKEHIEFDYTNPIDFYCAAYLPCDIYDMLCEKYISAIDAIRRYTIQAGDANLVRYYNCDTPLFDEPLLSELARYEFCYNPPHPVALDQYTSAYAHIWREYAKTKNDYDFVIFDGALLHHPINDMLRNYNATQEQAQHHIDTLLCALSATKRRIFYLETSNIEQQLKRAHIDRGQEAPTNEQLLFWQTRYIYDMTILRSIQESIQIYDVSSNGWNAASERISNALIL